MDKHKKKNRVHFFLNSEEEKSLQDLAEKVGHPKYKILEHFFEVMLEAPFDESLFLPAIKPLKQEEHEYLIRIYDAPNALVDELCEKRGLIRKYLGRLLCIRCLEICEQYRVQVKPEKEEIKRLLEKRANEKPSIITRLGDILHWRSK